jgi:hypothetical protein
MWSGHSCPQPLKLILILLLLVALLLLLLVLLFLFLFLFLLVVLARYRTNQNQPPTSRAADKSVRPTQAWEKNNRVILTRGEGVHPPQQNRA